LKLNKPMENWIYWSFS